MLKATFLALSLACASPLAAQPVDMAQVDVLPGWRTADGTHMAAIRITLAPGWHTYWRAPGDAGIPPSFDWRGSRNLKGVAFHWPVPEIFEQNGIRTIGYEDELILPMEVMPATTGVPVSIEAEIDLGVCEEICMPLTVRINAVLDGAGAGDPRIETALANQPKRVSGTTCAAEPISDGLRLRAELATPRLGAREVAVLELSDHAIWVEEATVDRKGGVISATSDMVPPNAQPFALDRSDLRLTVIADGRAVETLGCRGR